jgi:putative peptidoglycan lipid II flippase
MAGPSSPDGVPAKAPHDISRGLARSAGLIGAATLTSRVLGLVREQVMAYLFGAGNAVDAFNVAFRIPNLLRDLFAEGAMSAAFVPTFTRVLTREGGPAAWRLGNHVVNALLVSTLALVALGIVFAHPLVMTLAGDYAQVPGKIELTVLLTRVMLPFLLLVAIAAAAMGMLNSFDRYLVPALAPAVFNVCSILTTLALLPLLSRLGWPPILAMAAGVLAGGLGQIVLQWPALRRDGYRYQPILDLREPGLRDVLVLMGPGTLGLAATQVNVFVNTWLATSQGTGAVSWLNYAFRLMYLPLGLFGVSIATASVPAIARRAAEHDLDGLRRTLSSGVAMMLALTIPATFGLIVLARPIVALLFERGRFTAADTDATAAALMCYAIGLAGYSIVKVATPTFYAIGQSRTPVLVSALIVVANAGLNLLIVGRFGYRGLAFGTSISALANAGLLLYLLRARLGPLNGTRLLRVSIRMLIASLVMTSVAWSVERQLALMLPGHALMVELVRVGCAIIAGLAVLTAAAKLLRVSEFTEVAGAVLSRIKRGEADGVA